MVGAGVKEIIPADIGCADLEFVTGIGAVAGLVFVTCAINPMKPTETTTRIIKIVSIG